MNSPNWRNGTHYTTVFDGEGRQSASLYGLTPRTTYSTHCYIADRMGNDKTLDAVSGITTGDTQSPDIWIQGFSHVGDFSAKLTMKMRDPGKSYPGLTRCVARG